MRQLLLKSSARSRGPPRTLPNSPNFASAARAGEFAFLSRHSDRSVLRLPRPSGTNYLAWGAWLRGSAFHFVIRGRYDPVLVAETRSAGAEAHIVDAGDFVLYEQPVETAKGLEAFWGMPSQPAKLEQ
jgi:hypothetical protein